ncbi:MAG: hypothetical protein R3F39_06060 [Myxococcota bacterium]
MSADKPLSLHGVVYRDVSYRPWWARLVEPVAAAFALWPTYRETQGGRQGAWLVRGLVIAAAVLVAVRLPRPVGDVLGLAIGCLALIVPMAHLQHARRLARLRALASERPRPTATPAALFYDGQKLTIRAQSRVWYSLRAEPATAKVVADEAEGARWLGLTTPSGTSRDTLWFRALGADEAGRSAAALGALRSPRVLHLEAEAFAAVCEVFLPPGTGG